MARMHSTIRTLLFSKGGGPDDVISSIDVSVAFLQSDDYGPDDPVRYVSCPIKGRGIICLGLGVRSMVRGRHPELGMRQLGAGW